MMNRRTFLTGIGATGTIGAVSAGMTVSDPNTARGRAGTSAMASADGSAGLAKVASRSAEPLMAEGLMVAHLAGSAGMFSASATENQMRAMGSGLSWSKWMNGSDSDPGVGSHSLFKVSRNVSIGVGIIRQAGGGATPVLLSLDIVAHFAIDESPYFAPFSAWRFEAASKGVASSSSQPLIFLAHTPDRVALEINYSLDPATASSSISNVGILHLPIAGQTRVGAGLATGLYILVSPSTRTGTHPVMSDYVFSGNVNEPVISRAGEALDFDYLTLDIRPTAL